MCSLILSMCFNQVSNAAVDQDSGSLCWCILSLFPSRASFAFHFQVMSWHLSMPISIVFVTLAPLYFRRGYHYDGPTSRVWRGEVLLPRVLPTCGLFSYKMVSIDTRLLELLSTFEIGVPLTIRAWWLRLAIQPAARTMTYICWREVLETFSIFPF